MDKTRIAVAHFQDKSMDLAAVRVEADMAIAETIMVEGLHRATTMPTITHKCRLSSRAHISNTQETSKIFIEDRSNCKVLIHEWTSQGSITLEMQCHKVQTWIKTAKCYRQFSQAVARICKMADHSSICRTRCTASVDKTTGNCRKTDRRPLVRVYLAVEKALERFTNHSMHTVMTERRHNSNNWMRLHRLTLQCRSRRNQWEKDQQQSVWIRRHKNHDLNHLCRQMVRWTQHKMIREPVAVAD